MKMDTCMMRLENASLAEQQLDVFLQLHESLAEQQLDTRMMSGNHPTHPKQVTKHYQVGIL
jgi:hypothetical protein